MGYYGYQSTERAWKVGPGGVTVDLERGDLVIEATKGSAEPVIRRYPLLRARVCATCGAPVVVYAEGSVKELLKATDDGGLFGNPWEKYGKPWTLLRERGAFALVTHQGGHGAGASEYGGGGCRETELKVVWPCAPSAPARRATPVQGCLF